VHLALWPTPLLASFNLGISGLAFQKKGEIFGLKGGQNFIWKTLSLGWQELP